MFSKILVPIDGSENSLRALNAGAEIAKRFDGSLTVFYVIQLNTKTIGLFNTQSITLLESVVKDLQIEGEMIIDKAKSALKGYGINYDTSIVSGPPAQAIIEKASNDYDLIVLGSRGMGEVKGLIMGSVSDRVSHTAKQSILIVH